MSGIIVNKLKSLSNCKLLSLGVIISEIFTAIIVLILSTIFYGKVVTAVIIIGAITAFLVSLFVCFFLVLLIRRLRESAETLKQCREKSDTAEEKYRNLIENALVGIYKCNLIGEILYANDALARMLEFKSPDEFISEGAIARYRNPRDREVLIERLKETGRVEGFETKVITKTGKTKNVLVSATLDGDTLSGMIMDITDRKQAEEQLLRLGSELKIDNAELETLYKVSSAISRTMDINKLFTVALDTIVELDMLNLYFERRAGIFSVEGERMQLAAHLGHSDVFLNSHKDMKVGDCLCGLSAKTGEVIVSMDSEHDIRHTIKYPAMTPHGHIIIPLKAIDRVIGVLYLYLPLGRDIDKRMLKVLCSIGDQIGIAIDHARLYEETKALSLHDSLTGLANRRMLDIIFERNFVTAKRFGSPLSVVMLDIDYFKRYNDAYGHSTGDNMLTKVAKIALKETRGTDLVVRYGGEEFLILLPEANGAQAYEAAERIRRSIQAETRVTVSLGISSFHKGVRERKELIDNADAALYKAKQKGRNRVEVSDA